LGRVIKKDLRLSGPRLSRVKVRVYLYFPHKKILSNY